MLIPVYLVLIHFKPSILMGCSWGMDTHAEAEPLLQNPAKMGNRVKIAVLGFLEKH